MSDTNTTIDLIFTAGWSIALSDILEDLNIERQDIADMWIKYCVIHIEMKDGRRLELETSAYEAELDTKYPAEIYLFENYDCIASSDRGSGYIPLEPSPKYMYVLSVNGEPIFTSKYKYRVYDDHQGRDATHLRSEVKMSNTCFNVIDIHGDRGSGILTKLYDVLEAHSIDGMFRYLAPLPHDFPRSYWWGTEGMAHPDRHGVTKDILYLEVDSASTPPLGALKIGHRNHPSISLIECQYINRERREIGYWRSDVGLTKFPFPNTYAQCEKLSSLYPMLITILFPLSQDLYLEEKK